MSTRLRAQSYIFLFRHFYGSSSSRKENQTAYVPLPTNQISEDELDSSDDSDFTIEMGKKKKKKEREREKKLDPS